MTLPTYCATSHDPVTFRLSTSPTPGTFLRVPGYYDVLRWDPDLYPSLESIEALRDHGDPPADAVLPVLLKIRAAKQQTSMDLVQVLVDAVDAIETGDASKLGGVDMTQEEAMAVRNMWDEVGSVPDWADLSAIERGQSVSMQHAPLIDTILGMSSLAGLYSVQPNNQILLTTGYLFAENINKVRRRLTETGHMVFCASTGGHATFTPRTGAGWTSVLNVRFLHTVVRYRLMKKVREGTSTAYNFDKNRIPINQPDMLITALSFTTNVTRGLATLGFMLDAHDEQAYLHLWSLITHLLGVRLDLNPLAPEAVVRGAARAAEQVHGWLCPGSLGLGVRTSAVRGGFAYRVQDALTLALYCPDAAAGGITHTFVRRLLDARANRVPVRQPRYQLVAFAHRFWDPEYAAKLGFPKEPHWLARVDLWVHLNVVVRLMVLAWRVPALRRVLQRMYDRMHAVGFAHYVLGMPVEGPGEVEAAIEAAERAMARFGFHGMQPDIQGTTASAAIKRQSREPLGVSSLVAYVWVAMAIAVGYYLTAALVPWQQVVTNNN